MIFFISNSTLTSFKFIHSTVFSFFQSLGYRTLASMCSLLLGFFAASSPLFHSSLLHTLGLKDFQPLIRLIKEFLLLQSDAQMLQQEGLQASFNCMEQLEKQNTAAAAALVAATRKKELETISMEQQVSDDDSEPEAPAPAAKRVRRSSSPPLMSINSSPSRPAGSPAGVLSQSLAATTFDALFAQRK